ncbi:MAG TPA: hypothetical protein VFT88_00125 [Acidobacteriaceae bacterium]|jgi:hypothetical protein|nr:hypothetical protein [Acidobacteriaceae bacterium]
MNASVETAPVNTASPATLTNGSAAAAILAAGIGSFALGVLAVAGDKSALLKGWFTFYKPTGPLSGVTTSAVVIWLFCWGALQWRWRKSTVSAGRISVIALVLLALGLILTFPPIADFL